MRLKDIIQCVKSLNGTASELIEQGFVVAPSTKAIGLQALRFIKTVIIVSVAVPMAMFSLLYKALITATLKPLLFLSVESMKLFQIRRETRPERRENGRDLLEN